MIIDANLLVLLVVGKTGRQLISKHRRLRKFETQDYDRLVRVVTAADRVIVTPNTLTEASNLLGQHGEPERSRILYTFRNIIEHSQENVVTSKAAARGSEFIRLGLTDAVLLEIVSKSNPLITVDFDLYLTATKREEGSAFNFWHSQAF